ncbi:MAG: TolC family protein [Flavobacteriales bacterium]
MKASIRHIAMLFAMGCCATSWAQVLTLEAFTDMVRRNHPVAQQATNTLAIAQSNRMAALGAFDPKLEGNHNNKFFQGKEYYNNTIGSLSWPTRSPFAFKTGYELNRGDYLDPSSNTPNDGLYFAGISLPILQGLVTDERRTQFRIAETMVRMSEAERRAMINQLLFDASSYYAWWWSSVQRREVADELKQMAADRHVFIRQRALLGDRPLIDTLESFIQLQMRSQQQLDAQIMERKAQYVLNTYVWSRDAQTQVLKPDALSDSISVDSTLISWDEIMNRIPDATAAAQVLKDQPQLLFYEAKLDQIELEIRWKKEKLKPKLNVDYQLLSSQVGVGESGFSNQAYKWGLTFSFPLFLREARGDLESARLKLNQSQLDRDMKANELQWKARTALENFPLLVEQYQTAVNNVSNYRRLMEAERIRFSTGESSVFLVNQREVSYAEAANKRIELESKIAQTLYDLDLTLGRFK